MIAHFFCHDDEGQIMSSGSCPVSMLQYQTAPSGLTLREGLANHLTDYWDGEKVVAKPPQPSPFHTWDWPTKTWLPDVTKARESRKAEVDSERERHSVLPLTFDGKLLDADLKAQKNLSDKLQEVRERLRLNIPMPMELLVWRDADNVTHTFSDLQSYHDWLSAFAISIAERGTRLYTQAWQHKASIEQLSTVEDAVNYSISFS